MRLIEMRRDGGGTILINPDHVTSIEGEASDRLTVVHLTLRPGDVLLAGSRDEVAAMLALDGILLLELV